MRYRCLLISLVLLFLNASSSEAWDPMLEDEGFLLDDTPSHVVIGSHRSHSLQDSESLVELARHARVGFEALTKANPGVDVWVPPPGKAVLLPYATILPKGTGTGITINLADLRLYYVWLEGDRRRVRTYPVGIGTEKWETPQGRFTVNSRVKDPVWAVPPSIRHENPELPARMPPGPENPLGGYWLGLDIPGYGIHGTNRPLGVGRRISHGCLRLYPEDIRDLFARAKPGTPVQILYQPIKVGLRQVGRETVVFIEVHPDILERLPDPTAEAERLLEGVSPQGEKRMFDRNAIREAIDQARGIPVPISIQ